MFRLEYINPAVIHSVWGKVRHGIQTVQQRTAETYLPEDVYHAIKSGAATLHIGYLDNEYAGFVVLMPYRDQYTNDMVMHCWIAYSTGADVFDLALAEIQQMAKNINAKITFTSPRKAWEKRFKPLYTVYEVPL